MGAKMFKTSTDSGSPMSLIELDTHWSKPFDFHMRDSLARWGRDAKIGDTKMIGKIEVFCIDVCRNCYESPCICESRK